MGRNGIEWDRMGQNGTWTEWDRMGQNGAKWDKMGQNGTEWDRMGQNGTWTEWDRMSSVQCAVVWANRNEDKSQVRAVKRWVRGARGLHG